MTWYKELKYTYKYRKEMFGKNNTEHPKKSLAKQRKLTNGKI